jgi:hypothetical protein
MVIEQLAEIGLEADLLLEPMRRDSSPVPGRTTSRIRSSLTTMPSRAEVSNAIRPRSAVPNA